MSQSVSLVLSMALAVPVGIVTNLLTPACARFLGRSSVSIRKRLAIAARRESIYVDWLATEPIARAEALAHRRFALLAQMTSTAIFLIVAVAVLVQPHTAIAVEWAILVVLSVVFYLLTRNLSKYLRIRLALLKRLRWMAWDLTVWLAERGSWVDLVDATATATATTGEEKDGDQD